MNSGDRLILTRHKFEINLRINPRLQKSIKNNRIQLNICKSLLLCDNALSSELYMNMGVRWGVTNRVAAP